MRQREQIIKMTEYCSRSLFVPQLNQLYSIELFLQDKWIILKENASFPDIRNAFEKAHNDMQLHISRLEDIYRLLDKNIERLQNFLMEGLMISTYDILKVVEDSPVSTNIALLFYGQLIMKTKQVYFHNLLVLSALMKNLKVHNLLLQCQLESTANCNLFNQIEEAIYRSEY